jgi:mannosyl-oligosaccharide alpha-1,2-mannosidase
MTTLRLTFFLFFRNGWGASAVDAFSTALVMQIPEIVDTIVNFIPTIDFDHALSPTDEISLFETTIRYVGGMLSGDYISLVT